MVTLFSTAGGDIYGVTNGGGANGDGVVYMLTPAKTTWTETILFACDQNDGTNPIGGLTWNHKTNQLPLSGTTSSGNMHPSGDGSIFKLSPPAVKGGPWTEATLFQFTYRVNGGYPNWRDHAGHQDSAISTAPLKTAAALKRCDFVSAEPFGRLQIRRNLGLPHDPEPVMGPLLVRQSSRYLCYRADPAFVGQFQRCAADAKK